MFDAISIEYQPTFPAERGRIVDGNDGIKIKCGAISCVFEFRAYKFCGERLLRKRSIAPPRHYTVPAPQLQNMAAKLPLRLHRYHSSCDDTADAQKEKRHSLDIIDTDPLS